MDRRAQRGHHGRRVGEPAHARAAREERRRLDAACTADGQHRGRGDPCGRGEKRRSAVHRRRGYLRVLLELSSAVHGRYSQREQVTGERKGRKDREGILALRSWRSLRSSLSSTRTPRKGDTMLIGSRRTRLVAGATLAWLIGVAWATVGNGMSTRGVATAAASHVNTNVERGVFQPSCQTPNAYTQAATQA